MLKAILTRSVDGLIQDLSCDDPVKRQEARQKLVSMGPAVVPQLKPLLSSTDEHVRWEAAKALGDLGGAEAAQALAHALSDPSRDVRWAATQGLIASGEDGLEPLLHELITRSGLVWVREAGIRVLDAALQGKEGAYLRPVVKALKERAPIFAVPIAAYEALVTLHRQRAHLDTHQVNEARS